MKSDETVQREVGSTSGEARAKATIEPEGAQAEMIFF
jgi:hypothetical protein